MYRNCIFCSARLGANDALERFPVGRTLAFDGAKGRLWTVCRKCARWNLAPIEERWEAIEDAERLFRDTRLRVHSENIGLAKLRDGTRLIRVGGALAGEVAAWRYGREVARRRNRVRVAGAAAIAVTLTGSAVAFGGLPLPVWLGTPLIYLPLFWQGTRELAMPNGVAHRLRAKDSPTGMPLTLRWRDLRLASTALGHDGRLELRLMRTAEEWRERNPLTLAGPTAVAVLGKALVHINKAGVPDKMLGDALDEIAKAGGAEAFLRRGAARGHGLELPDLPYGSLLPTFTGESPQEVRENAARPFPLHANQFMSMALEMALHEETERRAMDGELAALESMWREAEQIADIADRLPDVPRSDPPRLDA